MKRRDFIKLLCASGVTLPLATSWLRAAELTAGDYNDELLIFINAQGGWDPLMFCDPKFAHRPWFGEADIADEGAIRYANIADDAGNAYANDFFPVFGDRMIVVQGINMQTNAHSAGVTNAFQGTFASGYPTLSAALAAVKASSLPMSYMVTGNYRSTGDLLPYTAISQSSLISSLARPNIGRNLGNGLGIDEDTGLRMPEHVLAMVDEARSKRVYERLLAEETLMPRRRRMLEYFATALDGSRTVDRLGEVLPPDGFQSKDEVGAENDLVSQADVILHAMAAGLTAAADAEFLDNPFDTHADHALLQGRILSRLVYGIRFIWNRAAELDARTGSNLTDRLVLVVASDFGRTPQINRDAGTDHWPTTSAIVMSNRIRREGTGARVVGFSTSDYQSGRINPVTLDQDAGGVELTSAHLHKALRNHLGIAGSPALGLVQFHDVELVDIFRQGADSTPQLSS